MFCFVFKGGDLCFEVFLCFRVMACAAPPPPPPPPPFHGPQHLDDYTSSDEEDLGWGSGSFGLRFRAQASTIAWLEVLREMCQEQPIIPDDLKIAASNLRQCKRGCGKPFVYLRKQGCINPACALLLAF